MPERRAAKQRLDEQGRKRCRQVRQRSVTKVTLRYERLFRARGSLRREH